MDDNTKHILEIIENIHDQMATRDDIKELKNDIKDIRMLMATKEDLEEVYRDLQAQITENTKVIAELSEQIRNVFGYAKEIDMLMMRVSTLEKHVGLK